jgi:hypothetical protein
LQQTAAVEAGCRQYQVRDLPAGHAERDRAVGGAEQVGHRGTAAFEPQLRAQAAAGLLEPVHRSDELRQLQPPQVGGCAQPIGGGAPIEHDRAQHLAASELEAQRIDAQLGILQQRAAAHVTQGQLLCRAAAACRWCS